jgi:septum formation protein
MKPPRLILASASPRRRELLSSLGLRFEVVTSDVEEILTPGEEVEEYVARLSRAKGAAVAERHPEAWVIAADTVVYLDRRILEKPADAEDAKRMLREIAGRRHVVYTAVSLTHRETSYEDTSVVTTFVDVVPLSEREIEWYVTTGEPMDKAGSYAVQGIGAMFIAAVEGNYTNVVGLPLSTVAEMFARAGLPLTRMIAAG